MSPDAETVRDLERLIEGCLGGLNEEIEAVTEQLARRNLAEPITADRARVRDAAGGGFLYEFRLTGGPYDIRPDDAVEVRYDEDAVHGFVEDYDRQRQHVTVSLGDWLGRQPRPAELAFDPTWLLVQLIERLEALAAEPGDYHPETALRLFGQRFPELGEADPRLASSHGLNPPQRRALRRVLGSDAHFVWGPPGTGKTMLLGQAAAELAEGGRVLVATTTNGALDEAARRVAEAMGTNAVERGRVIRVGAEYSETGDRDLSLDAAVERRVRQTGSDLPARLRRLERAMLTPRQRTEADGSLRTRHGRLVALANSRGVGEEIAEALLEAREALDRETMLTLREADVVLSTLARLTVWDELAALRFDSVICDEASTASLPYLLFAAALGERRAVAIGDFQQLPAVVRSRGEEARRWMSRDIFREAGVVGDAAYGELVLPSPTDRLCAMLTTQYRMAPAVRSVVSQLFYDGRLTDADEVGERTSVRAPLVLVDTDDLEPRVARAEGSRANATHVKVVTKLVATASREGFRDVGVVAPYRVQRRRLFQRIRRELGRAAPRDLEVSTIHSFQGREKDVVILDTVDAPPDRSWFLHEGKNPDFPRLLNVALSRTRKMLIVVAAREGLTQTLPSDALLNRTIRRIAEEGVVVGAGELDRAGPGLFGLVEGASGG